MSTEPNGQAASAGDRKPPLSPEPLRKPNRNWIWYFALLAILTIVATTILGVYNARQQLTPEQLAVARKLWEEKRPPDYVLKYTKKGGASGTFIVMVHHGKVQSAIMRQELVKDGHVQQVDQPLEPRLYRNYDMDGLFDDLERFLELAAKKDSPRTFMRADFDLRTGQLRRFVRSVQSTREWIEIDVEPVEALR